jgi:hypothetical protein
MHNKLITLLAMVLLLSQSCGQKPMAVRQASCEGVVCDKRWVSIVVTVRNAEGQPVQLDEAYTLVSKTRERLPQDQQRNNQGHYMLLNDSYRKQLENKVEEFTFVGMKDGAMVVEENYQIGADCCHVKKVSGKDVVVMK